MDVFLIPLGGDRYELYCEAPVEDPELGAEAPKRGLIGRIRQQFSTVLATAEQARNRRASLPPEEHEEPKGMIARIKARALAWLADRIAEQRLLWHLRHQTEVTLHHSTDMEPAESLKIARTILQRDGDRHRNWLAIDSVLMVLSAALILVPGPNVIGYYFAFRVVGHYLSMRGARQGLDVVTWKMESCEPLAELRQAIDLHPPHRERKLIDVASRLRLDHLAAFVERIICDRHARATPTS
jgi:hypothetical protein